MTTIRKEMTQDIPAREALLDLRLRRGALSEGRRAPARRPPAGAGLSFVAVNTTASSALSGSGTSLPGRRGRHCCSARSRSTTRGAASGSARL